MIEDVKTADDMARIDRELRAMRRVMTAVEEFDMSTAVRVLQQCLSMRASPAVLQVKSSGPDTAQADSDGAPSAS